VYVTLLSAALGIERISRAKVRLAML